MRTTLHSRIALIGPYIHLIGQKFRPVCQEMAWGTSEKDSRGPINRRVLVEHFCLYSDDGLHKLQPINELELCKKKKLELAVTKLGPYTKRKQTNLYNPELSNHPTHVEHTVHLPSSIVHPIERRARVSSCLCTVLYTQSPTAPFVPKYNNLKDVVYSNSINLKKWLSRFIELEYI